MLSSSTQVVLGINASFLAFYTGYSKANKNYRPSYLLDVLLVRKSLDHTLVELNKSISLSGLVTLTAAFVPPFNEHKKELIDKAVVQLGIHTAYSVYKYYGAKHIPKLSEWWEQGVIRDLMDKKTIVRGVKKLSILLGSLAQGLIWADYVKLSDEAKRNLYGGLAVVAGTSHFYLMELDYKWVLQVRPYAMLPIPFAAVSAFFAFRDHLHVR